MKNISATRRKFIKSSAFGIIGLSALHNLHAAATAPDEAGSASAESLFYRYPSLSDTMVSAVVGAAHTDLEKVKELVTNRPELACATWDWGFGDWETAIGAASHMGRRDIAEFLIKHGARPDIFTLAMMGAHAAVQHMVESIPGIQTTHGPHGITLLQHAKNRLRRDDVTSEDRANVNKVIAYLEGLGDADKTAKSLEISEEDQKIYFGEYRFGSEPGEVFVVDLNMRKLLQIGRKGNFGRVMNKIGDHMFSPGGAPSVKISFTIKDGKAVSLTVHEPAPLVTATRV